MVTCSTCGKKNEDDSKFCFNCGNALDLGRSYRKSRDNCFGRSERRRDDECFGLPQGGSIVGIIIGVMIILFGLGNVFGWSIDFGAFILILIGLLIAVGAIYKMTQERRK